jgi:hypothetical protein
VVKRPKYTNALTLYKDKRYNDLRKQFGYDKVFILSAGWGLVRGDTKIPFYNVTFSNQAEKECRITPVTRAKHDSVIYDVGECDELHLFITPNYLKYWNYAFSQNMSIAKKTMLHWRKGQGCPTGNYNVLYDDCGEQRTNWHYTALSQFLESQS